ncbi:MAG: hypothetical protein FJZ59_05810 [Chlamydiae bacterium]|nr:hypothetical protein [Chlamydiota bacterium]
MQSVVSRINEKISLEEENKEIIIRIESLYRKDLLRFFLEIVANFLVPGKSLYISKFNSRCERDLIFCDAWITPSSAEEKELITENYALLEEEIKLGLKSAYRAKKLLELKGLFFQEKEAYVAEEMRKRVLRFSNYFDYDIFPLMQKFLVSVNEEYKKTRSYQVLSKIISTCYLISQKIEEEREDFPDKRSFFLKLIPLVIPTLFGKKRILGCFVGMNVLKDNEVLKERHLLKAFRKYYPDVSLIKGSYFIQKNEKSVVFYAELESEDSFSFSQIAFLKKELKEVVRGSIETFVRPIFMPRNEEEIMKYIVTLSKQVTEVNDLPQIVIIFNEQTDENLLFTLLVVRPLSLNEEPIQNIINSDSFEVFIEKVRNGGSIKKNIIKEVSQIKISIRKMEFLREDFALDLYKARQSIVAWLEKLFGSVRDYNGGLIARQMEGKNL